MKVLAEKNLQAVQGGGDLWQGIQKFFRILKENKHVFATLPYISNSSPFYGRLF